MPPRKTSRPPPYAARNSSSMPPALRNLLRRITLRTALLAIFGFTTILWLLGKFGDRETGGLVKPVIGTGAPVVLVTVLDPAADEGWKHQIRKNREDYARRHGYLTFFPNNNDYPLNNAPASWSKVPALRHAMTLHPTSTYFWYLDSTALIMNPSVSLESHLLNPSKLESLMIANEPVVPPDSVIKTFANLKGDRIDVVVTQDREGLSHYSLIVRNGEWAKYFLDAWFDPIYRSYNFQKAETHALEHIVQWHGTILAKLAMVPQNLINAYAHGPFNPKNGQYSDGDLVATFPDCDKAQRCADDMRPFFDALSGKKNSD
ncbi:glycosyltransferase family 34 protein [Aaosphaeria arxii CBS 175.79]|uniref:Glycosyltransferase family 34 protein n=1 Tax=Aaosphaeria arxii CBS 175.79 TaxID=1450172 RepID=A0A6A5XVX9_9PLEO|nr:glycosyltransferase family 34 protein [Aaosphaeria arxii CBS 175.79]KAF2016987.1 glycosyltransferase family 34 protein [Aaosphaeria arxii CBS 175.79]